VTLDPALRLPEIRRATFLIAFLDAVLIVVFALAGAEWLLWANLTTVTLAVLAEASWGMWRGSIAVTATAIGTGVTLGVITTISRAAA
jgi:hypothetical protein